MSGRTHPRDSWQAEVRKDALYLDIACRSRWNVGVTMFRTAKYLFYVAVLLFTTYLIEATPMTTFVAVAVGVLLISGPEGLELYLVRQGYIEADEQTRDRERDDDRSGAGGGGGGGS
jgi:hypothetical protein